MKIDDVIRLNERSKSYNRGGNAIFIEGIDDFRRVSTIPKVYYKEVNSIEDIQTMPISNLLATIISMDVFVINPTILVNCLDDCSIGFMDFSVDVRMDYFNQFLEVRVYGARMGLFLPSDIVDMDASKIAKRVYKNCKKNLIPVSDEDIKTIEEEVSYCLDVCIDDRVDYDLRKWVF